MMTDREIATRLLLQAGKLLLELNESSGTIIGAVRRTAKTVTDLPCQVVVSYGSIAIMLGEDPPHFQIVQELHYNAALLTQVHDLLDQVIEGRLKASSALEALDQAERHSQRHSRWAVAILLAGAAGAFAGLMGADRGAAIVVSLAAALGLLVRRELGRRHFSVLSLPFAASCIGAFLGGVAIRLGWTKTPEPALVVPALMVVPGPHLINSIFDFIDNHIPMSLARLGLAVGILLSSALGIVVAIEATDPVLRVAEGTTGIPLNLATDIALAGIATCGFAAFFNTPWRDLGLVAACGMAGHGVRYLCLQLGLPLETATFLAGFVVGGVSACLTQVTRVPVAVIAFAGAVTMIPGSSLYHALVGTLQIARMANQGDPILATRTLTYASQGFVVVIGLALGLVLGIRSLFGCLRSKI